MYMFICLYLFKKKKKIFNYKDIIIQKVLFIYKKKTINNYK